MVKIYLGTTYKHIGEFEVEHVPRQGELISINDPDCTTARYSNPDVYKATRYLVITVHHIYRVDEKGSDIMVTVLLC